MTDYDLLLRLDERLANQEKHFTNHILLHVAVTIPALAIALRIWIALFIMQIMFLL